MLQEPRTAKAKFTDAEAGTFGLLNSTVPPEWTALYVAPTLDLPNNTQDFVFFQSNINFSHPVRLKHIYSQPPPPPPPPPTRPVEHSYQCPAAIHNVQCHKVQ